jgi:hypothetical protein
MSLQALRVARKVAWRAKEDHANDLSFRNESHSLRAAAVEAEAAATLDARLTSQQVWGSLASRGPAFAPLQSLSSADVADGDASASAGAKKKRKGGGVASATSAGVSGADTVPELPSPPPGPKAAAYAAFDLSTAIANGATQADARSQKDELSKAAVEEWTIRASIVAELEARAEKADADALRSFIEHAKKTLPVYSDTKDNAGVSSSSRKSTAFTASLSNRSGVDLPLRLLDPALAVACIRLIRFDAAAEVARLAVEALQEAEERARAVERAAVSARLRPLCLGSDRSYRCYWLLPGDISRVFVQVRKTTDLF